MNALFMTFQIFIWSIPFLLALALLTLLNFNHFFGFWLLSPYDYPFSYVIALFISLVSSIILLWIIKNKNKDYNPIILALFVFIGCISRLSVNTQIESALSGLFSMSIALFILVTGNLRNPVIAELIIGIANTINLFFAILVFYTFPLIFVFLGCMFQVRKPISKIKRLFYTTPAIFIIILFSLITFKTSDYNPSPGLIIPNQLRHFWGMQQFPNKYQEAIEEIKSCSEIVSLIGEIQNVGLAEGKNYWSMDLDGDDWAIISLEIVGTKGTAIIKGCAHDRFCHHRIYEDHSKSDDKKLYYGQCLD
ncbi:hypothetical protein [Nostoc sp. DedQUE12b]|uniref:hypothetical protein n=1 Tax=Nostoc sp. DedQUE12b TaxID=3075398 RepID=UPI002AD46359|nr:hypothetical protein [Nostoc sp. DedQUE12b]